MPFDVLGPLSARVDGQLVDLGGRQQRLVLAILIMNANQVVSIDQILDALWLSDIPPTARKTVQGYVSVLRRTLPNTAIETTPSGYKLAIDRNDIDSLRFEESMVGLERANGPDYVVETIAEALAEWSGRPYEDLEGAAALQPEITRLNELRLTAIEDKIAAQVDMADRASAIAELQQLVEQHGLRERFRALHMLALYRDGRQADALRSYEAARRYLGAEIGVEPGEELRSLERRILDHDPKLLAPTKPVMPAANPYRGLRPFDEDSADSFWGRDSLVRRLRETLDRPTQARLIIVSGASGSGKSSVVRAGLLPALKSEGWTTQTRVPGPNEAVSVSDWIVGVDLLVLDQLEVGLIDGDHAANMCEQIVAVATAASGWIVCTVRADFLDVLLGDPNMGPLVEQALVLVPRMAEHEVAEAVTKPADGVAKQVAPELVAALQSDMASHAGALPLMQYALTEMFDRSGSGPMTLDQYREVGGLGGALAGRAEQLFGTLSAERRNQLRAGLLRMVRLEIDGQPALRHVAQEDFGPGELDSLELFGTHRMVTFDRGSGATVAIAHEALLREWPRLAGWVDEAKDDLVALRRLELAAAEWQEEKRDPALVFSRSLTERYTQGLSSQAGKLEREFLAASEQRNADSERRRSRTRWAIMAGFGVAAVVAGVLAINARNDRAAAVEQREVAELRSLMNEVAAQATDKPDLALLLAVEAMRAASDPAGMGPMLKTLGGLPGFEPVSGQLPDSPIKLTETLFALDFGWKTESRCLTEPEPGRLFLATGADLQSQQLTIILDLNTGQTETRPSAVRCSFSVDPSQTLATGWDSLGRSFIFDLQTGENVRELPDVLAPQWLPDGRILAYSDSAGDGIRLVWVDPRTGDITETDTTARAFAPDPTGDLVLLSDGELWAEVLDGPRGQIIINPPPRTRVNRSLVSATDLSVVHDLGSVEQAPTKPVWSADGSLIGDVSVQGVLRVWDTATGEQVVSLPVAADAAVDSVAWVSFDATNSLVAVTRLAGEITIYNIANPDQLGTTVRSAGSTVGSVKTSSDPVHTSFLWENRLGVVYQDGHAEVIDLGANSLADRAIDVLAGIGTVQFGPDASAAVVSAPGGGEVIVDLSRGTTQDLLRDVDLVDHLGAWVSSAGDQVVMTADYQFTNLTSGAASAPLGPAPRFRPAGGIAPSGQVDVVNAWVLDSGSVTGPGVISVGAINLNSLTVESEPGVIELPVGTALVSALSDRIVLVTVAGTVFQYGYDGQPIGRRMNLSFAPSEVAAVAGSSKVLMRGADTFAMVDLDTNEILSSVRLDDVESAVRLDSDIAAIGRRGGDIELWSTAPLARIGTLVRAELRNRGGSIVGDGDGVWYSSGSRILRLAVSPEILTSTACRLAGRSLTAEEWSDFVSTSRPFEPACS